jgi:hypothetical protein
VGETLTLLALSLALAPAPQNAPKRPAAPPATPRGPVLDAKKAQEEIHALDQLLAQLFELQTRSRGGVLLTDADLAPGRVTREQILAEFDVRRAVRLGFEPKALRDRLSPGFLAELDLLAAQRSKSDVGPLAEPSPLLTIMLDVEHDLWREADRRRQRAGLKSPLDSGPLSQKLAPDAATVEGATSGEKSRPVIPSPVPPAPRAGDARLAGQVHYKAGRWADALAAWSGVVAPEGAAGIELEYQRADCLLRTEQFDEAIAAWEKLAADHPGTSWAAQAQFSLRIARAMQALHAARKSQDGGAR